MLTQGFTWDYRFNGDAAKNGEMRTIMNVVVEIGKDTTGSCNLWKVNKIRGKQCVTHVLFKLLVNDDHQYSANNSPSQLDCKIILKFREKGTLCRDM